MQLSQRVPCALPSSRPSPVPLLAPAQRRAACVIARAEDPKVVVGREYREADGKLTEKPTGSKPAGGALYADDVPVSPFVVLYTCTQSTTPGASAAAPHTHNCQCKTTPRHNNSQLTTCASAAPTHNNLQLTAWCKCCAPPALN